MTNTLSQTHSALNKTINGREYNQDLKKFEDTTYTFTELEKQVMDLFPIAWYVDDLDEADYGLDDPSEWLLDWSDVKPLIKALDITENQLKGIVGSLINKGAMYVESRPMVARQKML